MGSLPDGNCSGLLCGYAAFAGGVNCVVDDGSCWQARMVEAEISDFHDKTLQEANYRIKEILDGLPPEKDGMQLSFVHTEKGALLAWVRHGVKPTEDAVTIRSGHDRVSKALNLKEYKAR